MNMNTKDTKLVIILSLCIHTHLPEFGQRCLKSSLVSRHRARPFISKRPLSGRRSEYSFWAQWSQWATSALSHRDGFIPTKHIQVMFWLRLLCLLCMQWYLDLLPACIRQKRVWLTQPSRETPHFSLSGQRKLVRAGVMHAERNVVSMHYGCRVVCSVFVL